MVSSSTLPLIDRSLLPPSKYNSFINLFDAQAEKYSDNAFIWYETDVINQEYEDKTPIVNVLTYGDVKRISLNLACTIREKLGDSRSTIGILAGQSANYHVLLLALYRLRYPVLAISPKNSENAVRELLKKTNATTLIYEMPFEKIKDNVSDNSSINCLCLGSDIQINLDQLVKEPLSNEAIHFAQNQTFSPEDLKKVVHIVHSSGTTSTPKPIQWTNEFFIYMCQFYQNYIIYKGLDYLIENANDKSVIIAPLWHMVGTFAAIEPLVFGSSIYYFKKFLPEFDYFVNVIKNQKITKVTAPPFIVKQLVDYMKQTGDIATFQKLKAIVSGGAKTPEAMDKFFVDNGISFIVLYAMSESYGNLGADFSKERTDSNTYYFLPGAEDYSYMRPFGKNGFELVIKSNSPYLAVGVLNEDGEYETKDLFEKSDRYENGYVYYGRSDDTLIMINGEKTSAMPMENTIKSSRFITNCSVVGTGRHCTAVLIQVNKDVIGHYTSDEIMTEIKKAVDLANKDAPRHSRILHEMIKVIPDSIELPTTDKGTVKRQPTLERFQTVLDELYDNFLSKSNVLQSRNGTKPATSEEWEKLILELTKEVLRNDEPLDKDISLFDQGLDSLLSIQLGNYLSESIGEKVSQHFFYQNDTINQIVSYFTSSGADSKPESFNYDATTTILNSYLDRAEKELLKASTRVYSSNREQNEVVLLTGATGSLGTFILDYLLKRDNVKKVYVLVRGNPGADLMGRIAKSFESRGLSPQVLYEGRVEALPMNLNDENLGFSSEHYEKLRSEVTIVQACAWLLDFLQPVFRYDEECIKGLFNLVKFANKEHNPIHLHFISSISATAAYGKSVPETSLPAHPEVAAPMGYAQSKYIVEQLFHYLVDDKHMPCYIHRVGQLCGNSENGCWNVTEMYPMTITGGGKYLKKMPNLQVNVDWLPVNWAGETIADIMIKCATSYPETRNEGIFHVTGAKSRSWNDVLEAMRQCGMDFEVVEPSSWIESLSENPKNPAYKLLSFFQTTLPSMASAPFTWETKKTCKVAPIMREAPVFDKELLGKFLKYWEDTGFSKNVF